MCQSPPKNPKSPRGFLPRPLLRADKRKKKKKPRVCQIKKPRKKFWQNGVRIPPRHTAQKLLGQNPERKTPFPFSKETSPPPNQKCNECFSFGVAGVLASAWGFASSVRFNSDPPRAPRVRDITDFENRFGFGKINAPKNDILYI